MQLRANTQRVYGVGCIGAVLSGVLDGMRIRANSASAVYSAKRLMGRDLADVQEELKLFPFKLAEGLQPGEVLRPAPAIGHSRHLAPFLRMPR